jgi:hypothetical protein
MSEEWRQSRCRPVGNNQREPGNVIIVTRNPINKGKNATVVILPKLAKTL